jgi:ketosteroid isomerase-like protein
MAGELETVLRTMMDGLDKGDMSSVTAALAGGAQGIDEISRRWMRGDDEVRDYAAKLAGLVSDVHTEIRDPHEAIWGDTGVLTCWLDQDYTIEGDPTHISAPTTVVMRKEDGDWRVALFHSIPLPPEA